MHSIGKPLFALALLALLSLSGCNSIVANDLAQAQNLGSPIRGKDASAQILQQHHVWRQLRIKVGPPAASLSVWIVNPIPVPATVFINSSAPDGLKVQLIHDSQTRPSIVQQAVAAPKGTLFLLHGLGDSKEYFPYEFYSYILAGEGYRVVLVDSRGHGRSTGQWITYGFRESRDLVQVLSELQRRGLIVGNVGALGISYGASTAICWAAIDPRVRAVVALEPFSSLRNATADAGPIMLGKTAWMFSKNDLQNIALRIGRIGGFDIDRESPLVRIAHCPTPILLVHGKADKFLRPAHSISLHQADPDHSKLILVDGASHLNLWFNASELIARESSQWFQEYLVRGAHAGDGPATPPTTRPVASNPPVRLGFLP